MRRIVFGGQFGMPLYGDEPWVVRVLDFGRTAEGPYMVMEHLEGTSLDAEPPDLEPLPVMMEVAEALQACPKVKLCLVVDGGRRAK